MNSNIDQKTKKSGKCLFFRISRNAKTRRYFFWFPKADPYIPSNGNRTTVQGTSMDVLVSDFLHGKLAGTGRDPAGYYAAPRQYFLFKTPGAGASLFAATELSLVSDGGMFFVRIADAIALPVEIAVNGHVFIKPEFVIREASGNLSGTGRTSGFLVIFHAAGKGLALNVGDLDGKLYLTHPIIFVFFGNIVGIVAFPGAKHIYGTLVTKRF